MDYKLILDKSEEIKKAIVQALDERDVFQLKVEVSQNKAIATLGKFMLSILNKNFLDYANNISYAQIIYSGKVERLDKDTINSYIVERLAKFPLPRVFGPTIDIALKMLMGNYLRSELSSMDFVAIAESVLDQ